MRPASTFARFIANGLVATAVHYVALIVLIEGVGFNSAGLANGIAAVFGISASYVGNRYFVFQSGATLMRTLPPFLILYATIALLHATVLAIWTDYGGLPYTIGFLIGTAGSILISYLGNRYLVFTLPKPQP